MYKLPSLASYRLNRLIDYALSFDSSWKSYVFFVACSWFLINQYSSFVINHDDWDFLFQEGAVPGYGTPWQRTLWEGRWLNYIYYGCSQHLSVSQSFFLFLVAYTTYVGYAAFILGGKRFSQFYALAIYFSPIMADLSRWPTTITPAMSVLALASIAYVRSKSIKIDKIVLSISVYLLVMTYPSMSVIPWFLFASKNSQVSRVIHSSIVRYMLSYGFSLASIYFLNLVFHGYFGIQIQAWREPSFANDFSSALLNLSKYFDLLFGLTSEFWIFFLLSLTSWVICQFDKKTGKLSRPIIIITILSFMIEMALEMRTGIRISARSESWIWLAMLSPAGIMLYGSRSYFIYGFSILVLISSLVQSIPVWADISKNETDILKLGRIISKRFHKINLESDAILYLCGNPRNYPGFYKLHSDHVRHLQNMMWGGFNIIVDKYPDDLCRKLEAGNPPADIYLINHDAVLYFSRQSIPI